MRYYIILLILLSYSGLKAQPYVPLITPDFQRDELYESGQAFCQTYAGARLFYDGDSIISGVEYKILKSHPILATYPFPLFCPPYYADTGTTNTVAFLREDTALRKVYILNPGANQIEYLLYDFSLNVGDTIYFVPPSTLYDVISNIVHDTLMDGSISRKYYFWQGQYIMEGIGGSQTFTGPHAPAIGAWTTPICVSGNNNLLWFNPFSPYNTCLGTVSIEERTANDIIIHCANGSIKISGANSGNIDLYSVTGQKVMCSYISEDNFNINISYLSSGIYIYNLESEKNIISGKIIIP